MNTVHDELAPVDQLVDPLRLRGAACRDMDTEMWFPSPSDDRSAAVAVCERCPLQLECRSWGIYQRHAGIWGGLLLAGGRPDGVPRRWRNPYPLPRKADQIA